MGGSVLHETAVHTFIFSLSVELCHNWLILAVGIYFLKNLDLTILRAVFAHETALSLSFDILAVLCM